MRPVIIIKERAGFGIGAICYVREVMVAIPDHLGGRESRGVLIQAIGLVVVYGRCVVHDGNGEQLSVKAYGWREGEGFMCDDGSQIAAS